MWFAWTLLAWYVLSMFIAVGGVVYTANVKKIEVGPGAYFFSFVLNFLFIIGILVYFV